MIYGFHGKLGEGKTLTACELAFRHANKEKKSIVTNFSINTPALYAYCIKKRLFWLAAAVRAGRIYRQNDVKLAMRYSDSICMVDEATVFLAQKLMMGRDYKEFAPLIADMLQSRKGGSHLYWIAQYYERVAVEIRDVTNTFYHVRKYNNVIKFVSGFDTYHYERYLKEPTFLRWIKSQKEWTFGRYDPDIFPVFNTLERLDGRVHLEPNMEADIPQGYVRHGQGLILEVPSGGIPAQRWLPDADGREPGGPSGVRRPKARDGGGSDATSAQLSAAFASGAQAAFLAGLPQLTAPPAHLSETGGSGGSHPPGLLLP